MAIMVDQGLLKYENPVCEYWPEFAKNGKEKVTVADIMRHEGGMHKFSVPMKMEEATTEQVLQNKLGELIENETLHYLDDPKLRRWYHGENRDTIANEIFRRIEPQKRTMSQYLRDEILPNFGVDMYCGLKEEDFAKRVDYDYMTAWKYFKLMF